MRDSINLYATLATLVDRLDWGVTTEAEVIPWSCPVPCFGEFSNAQVATLGINPSNREFVDKFGNELQGAFRRFHTLESLGLQSWSDADARHLQLILDSCGLYFSGNPYSAWFRSLEVLVAGANASYYGYPHRACHLDLVPYATGRKWTELTEQQRSLLLSVAGDTLGHLLQDSPVRLLILNGSSVVRQFKSLTGVKLDAQEMPTWALQRTGQASVAGVAYWGIAHSLFKSTLSHDILVLGFNHNLQSSFGVSKQVVNSIADWIAHTTEEYGW